MSSLGQAKGRKNFSWRFGPSKFSKTKAMHYAEEVDTTEGLLYRKRSDSLVYDENFDSSGPTFDLQPTCSPTSSSFLDPVEASEFWTCPERNPTGKTNTLQSDLDTAVSQYIGVVRKLSFRAQSALPPLPVEPQNTSRTESDSEESEHPLYQELIPRERDFTLLTNGENHYQNLELFPPDDTNIYENLDDIQTYINIKPSNRQKDNILSGLVVDVESPKSGLLSGNSSEFPSPELSDSSVNLSPASKSPDSGVFVGLSPKPDIYSRTTKEKPDIALRITETLQKFELLEEETKTLLTESVAEEPKSTKKSTRKKTIKYKRVKGLKTKRSRMANEQQAEEVIAFAENIKPSDESVLDVEENLPDIPPEMPSSPPPRILPTSPVTPSGEASSSSLPESFPMPVPMPAPRNLVGQPLHEENNNSADFHDRNLVQSPSRVVTTPNKHENIGSRIVEHHIKEQRVRDALRNQTLELEDDGISFEDLERERLQVIESQKKTVKPRRLDNWMSPRKENVTKLEKTTLDGDAGEVIYESILANKEKTKSSWEARMLGLDDTTVKKSENKMASTLQPPPGFESESNGHVRLLDFTDDFIEVGAVIVEGELPDAPSPSPQEKPKIVDEIAAPKEPKQASKKSDFPATYFDQNGGFSSRKSHYFDEEPAEIKSVHNRPQETLIEREIRLQKEREEALVLEREMALKNLRNAPNSTRAEQKFVELPVEPVIAKKTQETTVPESKVPEKKVVEHVVVEQTGATNLSPAEARISEEIRELKRREEELKLQREQLLANQADETDNQASIPTIDEGHYSDAEGQSDRDFHSEANSSRVATPEVSSLEFSKFPHQRTQSLDSMSSGHSSGDHAIHQAAETAAVTPNKTKRHVIVKPFDEPEDEESTPAYRRVLKETPIEREIRLAREREEALRREKGLPAWATAASSKGTDRENRLVSRLNSVDKRDVQHRLATSRIQLEIDETVEREKELLSAGTIQTTSEDRVDDKVTRLGQLEAFAEAEIVKERRPLAKSVSTPSLFQDQPIVELPKADRIEEEPIQKPKSISRAFSTTTAPVTPAVNVPVRKFSNPAGPQRGLMEKFLASRGRMLSQPAFAAAPKSQVQDVTTARSTPGDLGQVVTLPATRSVPVPQLNSAAVQSLVVISKDEKIPEESKPVLRNPPPRRTFATAEEKIQAELREMQKREEELRANRMKLFAKSQPNLLAALDAEESQDFTSFNVKGSQLKAAVSIPDLLDAEDNPSEPDLPISRAQSKGIRRKNALIAQWENMIQQTNQ